MRTMICLVILLSIAIVGCSRDSREEAIDRVSEAVRVLNGDSTSPTKEHEIPLLVQEQQRQERIRKNTEWTPENQRLYPEEYCQAQLVVLDDYAERLGVTEHTILVELNKRQRTKSKESSEVKQLNEFLVAAKKAYLEAEAADSWPVKINGFALTREMAKRKIVEAARRIRELDGGVTQADNHEAKLRQKLVKIQEEQQRVVRLRDKVQSTINDIRTRKVIDGSNELVASLNAISDAVGVLGTEDDAPSIGDLSTPSPETTIDQEFENIIRE